MHVKTKQILVIQETDLLQILIIQETKVSPKGTEGSPKGFFLIEGLSTPYKLDRDSKGGGIMIK